MSDRHKEKSRSLRPSRVWTPQFGTSRCMLSTEPKSVLVGVEQSALR